MRISGTEPSSVILGQTKLFQRLKSYAQKVQTFTADEAKLPSRGRKYFPNNMSRLLFPAVQGY